MTSMNVSLTPELARIVQQKVESGLYNNASEVIREAIRQLDTNEQLLHELKLAHLREALKPGIEQARNGTFADYDLDALIAELDAEPAHKRDA